MFGIVFLCVVLLRSLEKITLPNDISPRKRVTPEKLTAAQLTEKSPPPSFMKSDKSFPCSHKTITGPYIESS
jgi:hypothetical protein